MSLAWNPKCVVQGAAMIGMYYAGQKSLIIEEEDVGHNFHTFAITDIDAVFFSATRSWHAPGW